MKKAKEMVIASFYSDRCFELRAKIVENQTNHLQFKALLIYEKNQIR